MIRSMTAFAGSETEIDGVLYGWEIRSVNHRYLDTMMRIPENLRVLEIGFRALLGKHLKRGKIDCFLNCRRLAGNRETIAIDRQELHGLVRIMREIESELLDTVPCSPLEILKWPGILAPHHVDPQALKEPLGEILQTAVYGLIECREREGTQLAETITDRCRRFKEQLRLMRIRSPEMTEKLCSGLKSRLKEISAKVDPVRFEQEIVFMLQKIDIDEELERLTTHLIEIGRVLEKEDVAGRRLDFLLQEMNREANTLGSKSADQETSLACVEMKVLIEQMREQVQNIE